MRNHPDKKLRLCTICARGGSKEVPNKNIKLIAGKPLLAHSIYQAKQSGLFEHIAISSDSDEILKIGEAFGADILVKRPDELAQDTSGKIAAIVHCATAAQNETQLEYDTFVDLDATSPLRTVDDIAGATGLLENSDFTNVITGAKARRSPYFNLVERQKSGTVALSKPLNDAIIRRQEAPPCFDMNASVYIWEKAAFWLGADLFTAKTGLFEMPEERSVDIDSALDWSIVEFLMTRKGK